MAEKKKGVLSLNDRHYRLLQGLSSSKPQTTTNNTPLDHRQKDYSPPPPPQLSAILDSVSPPFLRSEEDSPPPQFSAILDSVYPPSLPSEKDSSPQFSAILDSVSPPSLPSDEKAFHVRNEYKVPFTMDREQEYTEEEKKSMKVKIQGRRRLCKVSSTDTSRHENDHGKHMMTTTNDPDLADFDSPAPCRNDKDAGGADEIRDILDDLSSRLDLLTIEKKHTSRNVEQDRNGTEEAIGEAVPTKLTFPAMFEGQSDEDDDCVIVSENKIVNRVGGPRGEFQEVFDGSNDPYNDDGVSEDKSSIIMRGPTSKYVLPSKIATMLYPHQRDGLRWLWSLHTQGKGGILGDDMGLGKTMQICGFLAGLFHSRLIKRVLIVAPKTLLPHWIKELSAVGLSRMTREYFGTCTKTRQYELQYVLQDKGILLTTYDIVRNNTKSLCGDSYICDDDDITWDYMTLDEGHLIKNPGTQRAKSLLEIPSAHRIIISGTPIQNNLKELWALFNFCCPELLGDKNWFKTKYESPILRGNDKNATDRDKRIGSTVAKELREHIQPYFLRRLKSDVFRDDDPKETAKLSKKNEIIVWLKLTRCQRQMYEAFLKSELVLSAFDGSPLAALTILKKICDHPLLLTKRAAEDVLEGMDSMMGPEENVDAEKLAMHIADVTERFDFKGNHDNISCKISFIMSLMNHLIPQGHHILIFSQTRKMLNLIQDSLAAEGYEFLRIDGTTKASDRVQIVNNFQEGIGAPIFLLTSQVGGLGLTLTKADRVIVVDPAWNPSTDNQSVDRAYRIGQKKDVIVYRLMTCGTIEEKIYRKQIYKDGLFKTATEHKEQTRYFSQQDLRELFSLPKLGFDVSPTQQQLLEEHDSQHTMSEFLKAHVRFLETQGIAGVSQHSLLFSKTEPVPKVQEDEVVIRKIETKFVGNSSSTSRLEPNVDGAKYAFNPKDVKLNKRSPSKDSSHKQTEAQVNDRIYRLNKMLADKVLISRLRDNGENLHKQLAEMKAELDEMHKSRKSDENVICLDDISDDFQRVVNV